MRRNLAYYLIILLLCGAGIWWILEHGARLRPASGAPGAGPMETAGEAPPGGPAARLAGNLRHPLGLLLLQVFLVVVTARSVGAVFRWIHQPRVVGEMVAGILLGPSLLGLLAPAAQAFLFPEPSLGSLRLLSQIGVILFMFVVGVELNVGHLREQAFAALLVSHAGIVAPFFLGTAGALFLYRDLAPAGVSFSAFALFLGVSMSVTAFPVLARILEERGLTGSVLGATAIACAAIGDVTAWCLLAVVVALAQAGVVGGALWTVGLSLVFIAAMLLLVRPWLARLAGRGTAPWAGSHGLLSAVLVFVFAAALATELLGLHALFGAFLAGVCMPEGTGLRQFLRDRLETFSGAFLLPLFFAFTGLRTQIGLLDDARSWWMCLGIIALATLGKLGGTLLAARWTGMAWVDSLSLGVLMNTRGLVEIIVLNIGFDLGILTPQIFTMLVLMALVTTFLTAPLVSWIRRSQVVTELPLKQLEDGAFPLRYARDERRPQEEGTMAETTTVNSQITDAVAADAAAAPPVGRFVWHDLMTTDPEKAQKYYADLLGWTYKDWDMGPGGVYRMIHAGDTEWGGFMSLDPAQGIPSHWISYVTVADVDAAAAKAQELGGQAPMLGTDIPTVGRFAIIASPQGAYVSPYKSETSQGEAPDPAPAPGIFCWHELLSQDPQAEGKFFSEIFGWRIEDMPMGEMGTYHLFKRLDTGKDAGGMLKKPSEGPSAWLPYIMVESADATAARTGELGGKVWVQPTDIPNVGRFIVTTDPTGAYIAFLQPAMG